MRATRRNVLVILGVLTIAGGALFGTGAFTQVEAQRTVEVDTAGDSGALLGLNITTDELDSGSGDTIDITQDSLNQNATTSFDGALEVTNNGQDDVTSIDIRDESNNSLIDAGNEVMYFEENSVPASLGNGETATYDVVFNTTGSNDISNAPSEITIVAN